jgi:hypothetical protein
MVVDWLEAFQIRGCGTDAVSQTLNKSLKKWTFDAQPLKGRLISEDLRYR